MLRVIRKGKLYREEYETWTDVLNRLEEPRKPNSGNSARTADKEWCYGMTYDDAVNAIAGGWAEGAAKVYELSQGLDIRPPAGTRIAFENAVAGVLPDVPAFLAGDPESMWRPTNEESLNTPTHCTIAIPTCYSAAVDAETAFNRGVAIAAIIDALENVGVRVQVYTYGAGHMGGVTVIQRFIVKEHAQILDVDDLLFTVAHPSMLRRINHALLERSDDERAVSATYGGYFSPSFQATAEELGLEHLAGELLLVPEHGRGAYRRTPEAYVQDLLEWLPEELRALIDEEHEELV